MFFSSVGEQRPSAQEHDGGSARLWPSRCYSLSLPKITSNSPPHQSVCRIIYKPAHKAAKGLEIFIHRSHSAARHQQKNGKERAERLTSPPPFLCCHSLRCDSFTSCSSEISRYRWARIVTARLGFVLTSLHYIRTSCSWSLKAPVMLTFEYPDSNWMLFSWILFPVISENLYILYDSVCLIFESQSNFRHLLLFIFVCLQCKCANLQYKCCCTQMPFCLAYAFSVNRLKVCSHVMFDSIKMNPGAFALLVWFI